MPIYSAIAFSIAAGCITLAVCKVVLPPLWFAFRKWKAGRSFRKIWRDARCGKNNHQWRYWGKPPSEYSRYSYENKRYYRQLYRICDRCGELQQKKRKGTKIGSPSLKRWDDASPEIP